MKFDVEAVKDRVQKRLDDEFRRTRFRLRIVGSKEEDETELHLFVQPDKPDIHSEDFASSLASIEDEVEQEYDGLFLLLVPTAPAA